MHPRLGLAALAVAALAACNDSSTQPKQPIDNGPPPNLSVSTSCKATEVYQIITWLTPLRDAPLDMRGPTTIILTFSTYRQSLAQQLVLGFAQAMTPATIAKLNTPPNPPYATKEAAVAVLVADLMQCVGLPAVQAPPPGAYLPTGGLKVIDQNGGQFTTGDLQAGIHAPAGAVSGPHLFYIAEVPLGSNAPTGDAGATTCLPSRANVLEVGRCYDFAVIPDVGAKKDGLGFGGNGIFGAVCSPGVFSDEVHDHLELAKVDHGSSPATFTIYPRAQDNLTGSMVCDLGAGPPPPPAGTVIGSALWKMRGAFAALARPFLPSVANASDGVGSLFGDLTHVSLVYRTRPLTVSPASATVSEGGTQAFTVSPTDGGSPRSGPYVWSVNGVDVGGADFSGVYGTVTPATDGLSSSYTAPATVPDIGTVNVCVRRAGAPADQGCTTVTIVGSFVGSWSGTITYQSITQPVTMTVSNQIGSTASGDLYVYYDNSSPAYNSVSSFSGGVNGSSLSFTIPGFVGNVGAGVNLTKTGDSLDGTMAEIPGRTFTAHFDRVVITYAKVPTRSPTLSRSASPTSPTRSLSTTGSDAAFGKLTP